MSSQLPTIICVVFGIISWYYFNKFLESEREYSKLHKRFDNLYVENQKVRTRVKDLQSYKTDVSKTFQILDNELVMINDHLQKRNDRGGNQVRNIVSNANAGQQPSIPIHTTIQTSRIPLTRISSFANMPTNNVSLLTPELLSSLFNMNTEELRQSVSQQPPQQQGTQQPPQQQQQQPPQQQPQQQPQQPPQQPPQQQPQQPPQQSVTQTNVDSIERGENTLKIDEKQDDETEDKYDGGLQFTSSYDISAGNSGYDQYLLNN
jgi:hypothetical protein